MWFVWNDPFVRKWVAVHHDWWITVLQVSLIVSVFISLCAALSFSSFTSILSAGFFFLLFFLGICLLSLFCHFWFWGIYLLLCFVFIFVWASLYCLIQFTLYFFRPKRYIYTIYTLFFHSVEVNWCMPLVFSVHVQLNMLKSDMLGKNIFLQAISYLIYPSTTHRSNFAECTST